MDNSYKSWTKKEEQELMNLYKVKNLSIHEISNILQRSSGAIYSRLQKLNMVYNSSEDIYNINHNILLILEELKQIREDIKKISISYIDV